MAFLQIDERYCWFQHDGVNETLMMLRELFNNRLVKKKSWTGSVSPRFVFCGAILRTHYTTIILKHARFKSNITDAVTDIPPNVLNCVSEKICHQVDLCLL